MPVDYFAGYDGIARAGGVDLNVTMWKFDYHNGLIDTTNTSTEGFETMIGGVSGGDVSCDAYWDANAPPHDDPPNLIPGELVDFSLNFGTTGTDISFKAAIEKLSIDSDVKGGVKYSMTGKSSGTITFS